MSPQMATVRPATRPLARRMVSASSSAWVGCWCAPSPALITEQSTFCAEQLHRAGRVMAHDDDVGRMALSVVAVSISVSPLVTDEVDTFMLVTSAPSRLPAISKVDCVRVDDFEEQVDPACARAGRRHAFSRRLAVAVGVPVGEIEEKIDLLYSAPRFVRRWRCGKVEVVDLDASSLRSSKPFV